MNRRAAVRPSPVSRSNRSLRGTGRSCCPVPACCRASPAAGAAEYLQDPSIRLLADFFQNKGLEALKREDRQEEWYQDWIDYQAKHQEEGAVDDQYARATAERPTPQPIHHRLDGSRYQ